MQLVYKCMKVVYKCMKVVYKYVVDVEETIDHLGSSRSLWTVREILGVKLLSGVGINYNRSLSLFLHVVYCKPGICVHCTVCTVQCVQCVQYSVYSVI